MVAPGPLGFRNEHLKQLAEGYGDRTTVEKAYGAKPSPEAGEALTQLYQFQNSYLRCALPDWFYEAWGAVGLIPVGKPKHREAAPDVRPIGVGDSLRRVFHKHGMAGSKAALRKHQEPQQVALAEGGAHKLVHSVRMHQEERPGFCIAHLDTDNAFQEMMRAAIIERLGYIPELAHMQRFMHKILAGKAPLVLDGEVWGGAASEEGVVQGDPLSMAVYAAVFQEELEMLDAEVSEFDGTARAGADDVYVVAPAAVCLAACRRFAVRLRLKSLGL